MSWKQIKTRMPNAYADELTKYAKQKSMPVSEVVRLAIWQYIHCEQTTGPELNAIKRELNGIGNNINQLARHANTTGHIEYLANLKEEILYIREDLHKTLKRTWH
ncbi:MobC family plasmid mobilization relaxosome protein [Neokomagataea anthophila]|uniref:Plasmid mobilization relaxosome protein MobC n=1 Tax=Neokomagataea anthophila TaxID=2826925 RepID=A0ABS5E763_9PROT|nr:MobC family plasmid mobilization relaxosome protein [Neokomagataea anthophila]MBR0559743.1 plasmid mobilization relaxosome protein MobC [Neokomagataea anthophila]